MVIVDFRCPCCDRNLFGGQMDVKCVSNLDRVIKHGKCRHCRSLVKLVEYEELMGREMVRSACYYLERDEVKMLPPAKVLQVY